MANAKKLRTWIEVNKKAIEKNYRVFRDLIKGDCKLMAVVKSNAYGHYLIDFAKEMQKLGADWLGVDSIVEGVTLRKEGITIPILVLGYTLPENFEIAQKNNISLTISSFESLENLTDYLASHPRETLGASLRVSLGFNSIKIHLKIDTGMHRQGFFASDMPKVIEILKTKFSSRSHLRASSRNLPDGKAGDLFPNLILEGIYTHFAAAKNPAFPKDTLNQITEFKKAVEVVGKAGFKPLRHASATSGAILFPEAHFDMVRIGIGMYGLWPSKEVKMASEGRFKLNPALSWKTIIGEIKELKAGERLGYDFTERLAKDSRVAILPIGYWHGYPRALSSTGYVIIDGQPTTGRARILGRVTMDMITVDITDIENVKMGDEISLINENVTADDLADLSDTCNYEIVTRLNPLMKRIYI
jgi:alanine racemase